MARHLRDAAAVDPDRRQDQAGADAMAQPFLARHALRHRARSDHLADPRSRSFQIDFDFIDHVLRFATSDGEQRLVPLVPQSVASFYAAVMEALEGLGIDVDIDDMPNELPDPIRFGDDHVHASYDADAAHRFWQVLRQTDR